VTDDGEMMKMMMMKKHIFSLFICLLLSHTDKSRLASVASDLKTYCYHVVVSLVKTVTYKYISFQCLVFPEERCFNGMFQDLPACPSNNSSVNINTEHCWNDADRINQRGTYRSTTLAPERSRGQTQGPSQFSAMGVRHRKD
jgi:hypothetical protein